MSGPESRDTRLVDADLAMDSLLETLLAEIPPMAPPAAAEPVPDVQAEATSQELNIASELPLKEATEVRAPARAASDVEAAATFEVPEWASAPFKVLPFRYKTQRLAVPLVMLNGIARDAGETTRLPGQARWHLGVMPYRDGRLVRVDLGALLGFDSHVGEGQYLLVVGGGKYGLLVDRLEDLLTQEASDVRWQQAGEGRDWLAGVLPGLMCPLLDMPAVERRLAGAD